jgi:ABC-type lipoprotein release transport system permease subunit
MFGRPKIQKSENPKIMLFKLAWRNIWRNKRRTFITIASVAFAVFFSVFMLSIQRGAWDHMLNNVINFYYGYVQVHQDGYWDEQSIDHSFVYDDELRDKINAAPGVMGSAARIESFALASIGEKTMGVMVVGTDPVDEEGLTNLAGRVVAGKYWGENAQGVLVADGIADQLGLHVGDTLILISQGYHGANAAGKYPITALLHFGSPELNKRMVYLPLPVAQYFFAADDLVTSVALNLDSKETVPRTMNYLRTELDTAQYEVMNWEEMIPDLVEAKELDSAGNDLILVILYIIITFGIFGTILMMTQERQYEFGVLIGIGMGRGQLAFTIWLEIIFLGLIGALAGMALAFPLVYNFYVNPIDMSGFEGLAETYEKFGMEPILPAIIRWWIFGSQATIVFLITSLLAAYPLWKIWRLQPIKAMRA